MKVVAFNGSPNKEGNTYHAIKIVTDELEKSGIETEIIQVGNKNLRGCMACNQCIKNKNEKCIYDDGVNEMIQKMKEADGIILGSCVHFSGITGSMKSFLDRAFYVIGFNGNFLRHKVGTSLVAVRRTGGMPALEQLDNYIKYAEMISPSSTYWNVIHGAKPGEVLEDKEGVQTLNTLGKNMAYTLELIENGKDTVIAPEKPRKKYTNFIR
ncbi:flavodoxin family protein [Clostridiaceae bacterium HSG29]|nr:flavodoxin family protein [Clostridiaceae bacterium HSG29]